MANRWYVKLGNEELGPLSDAGLRRFLESDQAGQGALVRNGRDGRWLPASQCDAVQAAQGGAATAATATAPASAPSGQPANGVKPMEDLPSASGQTPMRSRPVVLLAVGMGVSIQLSVACIGGWLLVRRLSEERQIAAAPSTSKAAPQSRSVADLENETKRMRQELAELQDRLRDRQQPPAADASPTPPAADPPGEQAAKGREERIEQLQSQIRATVAALNVDLASQLLKQCLPLVDGEERDRAMNLLGQLEDARIENLLQYVRAMPEDARHALADKGPAPPDLMRQFNDPDLLRALQKQLPHLASFAIAEAKYDDWRQLGEDALRMGDLTALRKWAFLQQAFSAKLGGQLSQDRVAGLVNTFGVFRLEGEPSLLGGLLADPADAEAAFRNGAQLQVASSDLQAECRKLAGDVWPPDEPPHSLAGHWAGRSKWRMYVDPGSDEITFVRRNREPFVQRICKIGPDYLAAYEVRLRPGSSSELTIKDDPFTERLATEDENPFGEYFDLPSGSLMKDNPLLPYSEYGPDGYLVLTLYRRSEKSSQSLAVYRKEMQEENLGKEALLSPDGGFWNKLGIAAEDHREQLGFRRIDAKLKP